MSYTKSSKDKIEPSFHTTLRKTKKNKKSLCNILQNECAKYITASKMHSQSKSFQTTACHSNQLNMLIEDFSYNCSVQSEQWAPFKIYCCKKVKYILIKKSISTELPEFSLNLKYFLKIPWVFQVFLECHKKYCFFQVFQVCLSPVTRF